MKATAKVTAVIAQIFLFILVVGSLVWFLSIAVESNNRHIFTSGMDAASAGVPAEANPYLNDNDRELWLRGYIHHLQGSRK